MVYFSYHIIGSVKQSALMIDISTNLKMKIIARSVEELVVHMQEIRNNLEDEEQDCRLSHAPPPPHSTTTIDPTSLTCYLKAYRAASFHNKPRF